MTKAEIRKLYLEALPKAYPSVDYSENSRALEMARIAADNALAGKLKLQGECWTNAVKQATGWKRWTMAQLAQLPEF